MYFDSIGSGWNNKLLGNVGSLEKNIKKNQENWDVDLVSTWWSTKLNQCTSDVKYNIPRKQIWLVVSTHLKSISQIGSFPQVVLKIKNIWNHQLEMNVPYLDSSLPTIVCVSGNVLVFRGRKSLTIGANIPRNFSPSQLCQHGRKQKKRNPNKKK